MRTVRVLPVVTLAAVLCGGCVELADRVFAIEATGTILGTAFVDANGDGRRDGGDRGFPGLRVRVGFRNVRDTVAVATTGDDGRYALPGLPVGDYEISVDPASVPDSLRIVAIDSVRVRVASSDTAVVTIMASYPRTTVEGARALPAGRRVFVDGVVLNRADAFPENAVHATGRVAAMRLFGFGLASVEVADSVRVLGLTARRDGQPTLDVSLVQSLGAGAPPVPLPLSTSRAATADGGTRDAALVRVVGATVVSSGAVSGEFRFTLDDGSGPVEAAVRTDRNFDLRLLDPGTRVDITGVLAPSGSRWRLRPRTPSDISLGFPVLTVIEARGQPAGRTVIVVGRVLNSRDAFGDTTVHISDATGAMRGTRVRPGTLLAGDLARFVGTTSRRDGQPVLDDVQPFVLEVGSLPPPIRLTSVAASTANNGTLDAAQVQIRQVVVSDTVTVGNALQVTASDGSGPVVVLIRKDTGIPLTTIRPNAIVDFTGLLVPDPATPGRWRVRVRTATDILVTSS